MSEENDNSSVDVDDAFEKFDAFELNTAISDVETSIKKAIRP